MTSLTSDFPLTSLSRTLAKNWWLFLLRGIAALAFGVLALMWPGITLITLVLFYGAYALVDGVLALGAGIFGGTAIVPRWWLVIVGLIGIGAGVATLMWPGITALVLLYFIAGWYVATGVLQIAGAIELRKEIANEWLLILNGLLSVAVGVLMFAMPGAGALALIWRIGFSAILYGVIMMAFAFKLRTFS